MKISAVTRHRKRRQTPEQIGQLIGRLRIGELNKLFGLRYGNGHRHEYVLPDDDSGNEDLEILIQHYSHTNPHKVSQIIKLRAPWMKIDKACSLIERVNACPRQWRAETLGRMQRLTRAEWQQLNLRTIAPIDMTREERQQERKLRARLRKQHKRRIVEGRKPRNEWLTANNKSRNKPWQTAGMSRRTWYRQQAKLNGTGVSPIKLPNAADTPVPNSKLPVPKEAVRRRRCHAAPPVQETQTTQSAPPTHHHAEDKPVPGTGVSPIKIGKT